MRERFIWRSRWAAVGAAVAVSIGAGGVFFTQAASPESNVVTIDPARVLDTRDGNDIGLPGPFTSKVPQDLQVTGSIPTATGTMTVVPAGATGVFVNATNVNSTSAGFISIRPANAPGTPSTSNLNFEALKINPNGVLVELPIGGPDDGKIEITYDAFGAIGPTSDVLIDIVGYTLADKPPAGVNFADGDQFLPLTSSPQSVRSVELDAPAAGFAIITASGFTDFETTTPTGYDAARCTITDGTISFPDSAHDVKFDDAHVNASGEYRAFSATRTFPVAAGTTTFRLVCEEISGEVDFYDSQITALYIPNSYAP